MGEWDSMNASNQPSTSNIGKRRGEAIHWNRTIREICPGTACSGCLQR